MGDFFITVFKLFIKNVLIATPILIIYKVLTTKKRGKIDMDNIIEDLKDRIETVKEKCDKDLIEREITIKINIDSDDKILTKTTIKEVVEKEQFKKEYDINQISL